MAGEQGDQPNEDWRQGDLVLAPLELPILDIRDGEPVIRAISANDGVAIVTQSCDLVREIAHKPYVQVAALVPVVPEELQRIKIGATPGRVWVPGLSDSNLAIDLDACATVHKAILATWPRTAGCIDDEAQRAIGAAFGRHRQRFAFPDDFNDMVKPIRKWFESKRSKDSAHGRLVRAAREVRVTCNDWNACTELTFTVLSTDRVPVEDAKEWQAALKTLEDKAEAAGTAYPRPQFRIVNARDMSVQEYLTSDRLDWEGLSDA